MAMLIQSYGGRRSIKFGTICSDAICTNRGVIAGCSFAVSVIKCFTMDVYDRMYELWPSIDLTVVIDDSTVQANGGSDQVVNT
eukprot:4761712-Pyramimonas_sp.AAC.1